jgi:hypothetical protein
MHFTNKISHREDTRKEGLLPIHCAYYYGNPAIALDYQEVLSKNLIQGPHFSFHQLKMSQSLDVLQVLSFPSSPPLCDWHRKY